MGTAFLGDEVGCLGRLQGVQSDDQVIQRPIEMLTTSLAMDRCCPYQRSRSRYQPARTLEKPPPCPLHRRVRPARDRARPRPSRVAECTDPYASRTPETARCSLHSRGHDRQLLTGYLLFARLSLHERMILPHVSSKSAYSVGPIGLGSALKTTPRSFRRANSV